MEFQEGIGSKTRQCEIPLSAISRQSPFAKLMDNGAGMSQDALAKRQGLGLTGMRERAQQLHGRLEIESEAGKGTMVKATVPLG